MSYSLRPHELQHARPPCPSQCKSKPQWGVISHQSEWLPSKSLQTINAGEGVEKREPSYTAGGNANWYSDYGEQYGDSLKTGTRNSIWPSSPIARHIHQENQKWKRHMYTNVHWSTVYNSQDMEETLSIHPLADERIRKLWYTYIMGYYSAIKKDIFKSVLMRWTKLEPTIQSEISQKEKHQYSILMHICGI